MWKLRTYVHLLDAGLGNPDFLDAALRAGMTASATRAQSA
jgi:hypothetical protein